MKGLLLATSIALLSLSSAVVIAEPGHGHGGGGQGHGHGRGNDEHGRGDERGRGDMRASFHGNGDERGDHRWVRGRHHGYRYAYARGHRLHHDNGLHLGQFRRGERLPERYMDQRYYIDDYRTYNLTPPPSGYRWVRPADGRYLLISTATGLISRLLGY